jgi:hypothetical protein
VARQDTLLDQRLAYLLNEERIAFGLAVDPVEKLRRDLLLESRQRRRSGRATAASLYAGGQVSFVEQNLVERARFVQLDFAVGHHRQQAQVGLMRPARQMAQHRERAAVGPVGIFEDEHHRPVPGEGGEQKDDAFREALLLGVRIGGRVRPHVGQAGASTGARVTRSAKDEIRQTKLARRTTVDGLLDDLR